MKVALVTAFPRDPGRPEGGVEAISVPLAAALAGDARLDVHVVTLDAEQRLPSTGQWSGITIHRLPRKGRTTLGGAIGSDRRQVQRFLETLRPAVIHAHDVYGLMTQGLRVPRVFTIHGFIHSDTALAGGTLARVRSLAWRLLETRMWAEQPNVIAISPYVRERLTGVATGTIHDIDNPVTADFFTIERQEVPGRVFCAGALCRRKNQLSLIDAVGLLRRRSIGASLRLAGPATEPDYVDMMQRRIEKLQLGTSVTLLGSLSADQIREELAEASLFALVSLEEGSPVGIEEAMAAGIPVIGSNRCGMPYLIRDEASGFLIDPHDPGDIAGRIEQLLTDDALRTKMGGCASKIAHERFHPTAVARRTSAVYARAIGRFA